MSIFRLLVFFAIFLLCTAKAPRNEWNTFTIQDVSRNMCTTSCLEVQLVNEMIQGVMDLIKWEKASCSVTPVYGQFFRFPGKIM